MKIYGFNVDGFKFELIEEQLKRIKKEDITSSSFISKEKGKIVGLICLSVRTEKEADIIIARSEPVFESHDQAHEIMSGLVEKVRSTQ